jgi:hypothetical protein
MFWIYPGGYVRAMSVPESPIGPADEPVPEEPDES